MSSPIGASGIKHSITEQFSTVVAKPEFKPRLPDTESSTHPKQAGLTAGETFHHIAKSPPSIPEPISFSAEDLADQLRELQSKQQDMQLQTAKQNVEGNKTDLQTKQAERLQKINEATEALAKKKDSDEWKFWLSVAGGVAGVIGSAVAFVASCVTGNAVGAIFSACAFAGAAFCLVNTLNSKYEFLKDEDGNAMNLQVSGLATKLAAEVLEAAGVDKEKAKSIGKILAGAVAIVGTMGLALLVDQAFVTNIVSGGMELGGVNEETMGWVNFAVSIATALTVGAVAFALSGGGSAASKGAEAASKGADIAAKGADNTAKGLSLSEKLLKELPRLIHGTTGLVGGAMKVGESGAGIASTVHKKEADDATFDKKMIDAVVVSLMAKMQENTEDLKKLLQEIEAAVQGITQIINSNTQSHLVIAANLSGRSPV